MVTWAPAGLRECILMMPGHLLVHHHHQETSQTRSHLSHVFSKSPSFKLKFFVELVNYSSQNDHSHYGKDIPLAA